MYIIRNSSPDGDNKRAWEIIKLKPDRQPIGIYMKEIPFTNHRFQLKSKDRIYMASDGFIDQFGGQNSQRFKTKRYDEFLLSIQDKSIEQHKELFEKKFAYWKGENPQIDDILILGIQI